MSFTFGQVIIMTCADWSRKRRVLSGRFCYGLLYFSFDICL